MFRFHRRLRVSSCWPYPTSEAQNQRLEDREISPQKREIRSPKRKIFVLATGLPAKAHGHVSDADRAPAAPLTPRLARL